MTPTANHSLLTVMQQLVIEKCNKIHLLRFSA